MPANGVVDFSLIGVRARIFDTGMRLVAESSYTPDTTYLVNFPAGKYIVEYEYWSSNTRDAVAYSPALLSFGSLPQLRSAVYSSSENTTTFHRLFWTGRLHRRSAFRHQFGLQGPSSTQVHWMSWRK